MSSRLSANPKPIPILVYHQIDKASPKGQPFRSLYVSPDSFARQMKLLKVFGYTGLSMSGLLPYLLGERQGKVVGITFDDGYLNNLTFAQPVLEQHGFSSTCYVVSARLGQTNLWDQHIGIKQAPLMDASQIRGWIAGGQEIGCHTRTHVNLPTLDDAGCRAEISGCRAELEALACKPIQHFCYPYGQFEPRHVDMHKDTRYMFSPSR